MSFQYVYNVAQQFYPQTGMTQWQINYEWQAVSPQVSPQAAYYNAPIEQSPQVTTARRLL